MMTGREKMATEMFKELFKKYDIDEIPLEISDRRKSLGTAFSQNGKPVKVHLNKTYINTASTEDIEDTIKHEFAHVVDTHFRGISDHGPEWQALCRELGCAPKPYKKVDVNLHRYHVVCKCCDQVVAKRHVATKKLRQNIQFGNYKCGLCGGLLKLVDTK